MCTNFILKFDANECSYKILNLKIWTHYFIFNLSISLFSLSSEVHAQAIGKKYMMNTDSSHINVFRMDIIKLSTDRSQLTIFRLVNIE